MIGWQWHQLDHMQITCTSHQTDKLRQHLITQFFTGQMLFMPPNQQCQSTEGITIITITTSKINIGIIIW